jgi:hypothetical protein
MVMVLPALAQDGPPPLEPVKLTAVECQVWSRELALAQSVAKKDKTAFAALVHPDAVWGAGSPVAAKGRAAFVAEWAGILEGKDVILRWRPHWVSVGGTLNVAVSRGPYTMEDPSAPAAERYMAGQFGSVWVRDNAQAPWLLAYDGLGSPPVPVKDKAEFDKILTAAPQTCPQ